jgi:hypothetical protein
MVAVVIAACVADCATKRVQIANYAQNKMVGLTKEQVLACMGPPASKAAEGATEVWSYPSGNCTANITDDGRQIKTAELCWSNWRSVIPKRAMFLHRRELHVLNKVAIVLEGLGGAECFGNYSCSTDSVQKQMPQTQS